MSSCNEIKPLDVTVYETSESGNKLTQINEFSELDNASIIKLDPKTTYQTITGFGGAFTETSAYLLNQMSKENRALILNAYFSEDGAQYSLTRTHMNSCDFSLNNYSYAPVADDVNLEHFSVQEDKEDLIHKAVGWMLREMGKKDVMLLRGFLKQHSHEMPRTMLRYAIERIPEKERKKWLTESKS